MKIHHVIETVETVWDFDPVRGATKVQQSVLRPADDIKLVHEGQTYLVGDDGAFEVPDDLGRLLCGRAGWYEGPGTFTPDEKPPQPAPRPAARRRR